MDRIISEGTIEVEGKRLFFDGDPHAGSAKPATVLKAAWFNSVQEEICNTITSQGITLEKNNFTQLQHAIEISAYRLQICTHLQAMVAFIKEISSEVTLPDEVTLQTNISDAVLALVKAVNHISSEPITTTKPNGPNDIDNIVKAINKLIPKINQLSSKSLNLLLLPRTGA